MADKAFAVMIAGIAQPGMEDYVAHFFGEMVQKSRKDAGCLIYNIHRSTKNPAEFMLYSAWKNEESFEQHNQTDHMDEFKHKLADNMFEVQSPKTYWELIE